MFDCLVPIPLLIHLSDLGWIKPLKFRRISKKEIFLIKKIIIGSDFGIRLAHLQHDIISQQTAQQSKINWKWPF